MSSAFQPQNPFGPRPISPAGGFGSAPSRPILGLPDEATLDGPFAYVPDVRENPDGHGGTVRFVGRRQIGRVNEFDRLIPD